MEEQSPYMKIEGERMKASQCEGGRFKEIEGIVKECHIRSMGLLVIVLNQIYGEGSPIKSSSVSEVSRGSRQWRPYHLGRVSIVVDVVYRKEGYDQIEFE
ncbi:hypothetical protein Tco_0641926 [Tanacetum coccineum]